MEDKETSDDLKNRVFFNYIKNSSYRQIHIDGCYGNLTPNGSVSLVFFAERLPVPRASEHQINDDGSLGEEIAISDDSLQGIVREIEFSGYLEISAAIHMKEVLEKIIDGYANLMKPNESSK